MQESAPQWEPITIDHMMSWEIRLFIFYVIFVLVFFLVRVTQLSWFLWTSRKVSSAATSSESQSSKGTFVRELALASIRAVSLKRGSVLTLLLALVMSLVRGSELLKSMSIEKLFGPAAIAGTSSEIISALAFGVAVSSAMYAAFAVFDGQLSRLKLRLEHHR